MVDFIGISITRAVIHVRAKQELLNEKKIYGLQQISKSQPMVCDHYRYNEVMGHYL